MSAASPAPKPQPAPAAKPGNARKDAPSLLAGPVQGPPPADTPRMIEIDTYLNNASDAIQNAIRSQACRLSIESVTSDMSAFSTTSTRHKEWDSTIRTLCPFITFRIHIGIVSLDLGQQRLWMNTQTSVQPTGCEPARYSHANTTVRHF